MFAGDECCSEGADETGGVKSDLMKSAFGNGAQSRGHLDASHITRQHIEAIESGFGGGGQRCRKAACRGVDDAGGVGIVKIEAVNQDAVQQHRIAHL